MKMTRSPLCLALLAAAVNALAGESAMRPSGRAIALGDMTDYTILSPAEATGQEEYAAGLLRHYLRKITGAEPKTATEPFVAAGPLISVGNTALAAAGGVAADPRSQAYKVEFDDDGNLFILGGRQGPLYGVIAVLQEDLGVRWYSQRDAPVIPKTAELSVVPRVYAPVFEIREPLYNAVLQEWDAKWEWLSLNRVQALSYFLQLPPERGGGLSHPDFFVHTYNIYITKEEYFDTHPEYFPLLDGKRFPADGLQGQVCYTEPGVAGVFEEKIRAVIEKAPWFNTFSVSSRDNNLRGCECERCAEIIMADGNSTGAEIYLANKVAERLAPDYPDIRITFLAYVTSQTPSKHVLPHPNLVPIYAPISLRGGGQMLLPWKDIPSVMEELSAWNALTENLFVWDYVNRPHVPLPNMKVMTENLRTWRENGVNGVFVESAEFTLNSLGPLKAWVFMQQLWNPDWDMNALADEFIVGYYGPASAVMREYATFQQDKWDDFHGKYRPGTDIFFTPGDHARMREMLERAYAAAEDDAATQRKIAEEYCAIAVQALRACTKRNMETYAAVLARVEELLARHGFDMSGFKQEHLLRNGKYLAEWRKQLEDARDGSSLPLYCDDSIVLTVKGAATAPHTSIVEDKAALTGLAGRQQGVDSWGMQWVFEKLLSAAPNQQVYVVRTRMRGEFTAPRDPDEMIGSLCLYRSGIEWLQTSKFKFSDIKPEYDFVYACTLRMSTPMLAGYFFHNTELQPDESLYYDYIEFIPIEQFKEKDIVEQLPSFIL